MDHCVPCDIESNKTPNYVLQKPLDELRAGMFTITTYELRLLLFFENFLQ